MRLTFAERIGSLRFRRYQHERYGVIETLTKDKVTFVRPVFCLPQPETEETEAQAHACGIVQRSRVIEWPKASARAPLPLLRWVQA